MKFLILFVFYIINSLSVLANDKTIKACIDDYPPYQITSGEQPSGIFISAIHVLAKKLNRKPTFIIAPNHARCLKMLELSQVDVIAGLNMSEERNKFAFFSPFKEEDPHVVISHNNTPLIVNYEDFSKKKIAIPNGTTYFKKFDHDNSLIKMPIKDVKTAIKLLLKKRVDLVITSEHVAQYLLPKLGDNQLRINQYDFENITNQISYFGFSKNNNIGLSQEQIIFKVQEAFTNGEFNLAINEFIREMNNIIQKSN